MKIITKIIFVLFVILLVYLLLRRRFYCIDENRCITVWKTFNNRCYIIPNKYYGVVRPFDNYIQTTNVGDVDIIWDDSNNAIIAMFDTLNSKVIYNNPDGIRIIDYYHNKEFYSNLLMEKDGIYKKNINYLHIYNYGFYAIDYKGRRY